MCYFEFLANTDAYMSNSWSLLRPFYFEGQYNYWAFICSVNVTTLISPTFISVFNLYLPIPEAVLICYTLKNWHFYASSYSWKRCVSRFPSHSLEHIILAIRWNFFKLGSNVHLDPMTNGLDCGGKRSWSLWPHKTCFSQNSRIHMLMQKIHTNL